ncbi:MAG: ProQ/FinO family protein [Rickettsiaceae bacterium]|nr:ProQ/FinO family protein [Rickettsiaceae bacterium]
MSEESTLSLSHKLSPEIQNKLQQLAGKPDTTKSELPKIDNTNTKVDNNKTNRPNKSKLSQEELEKKHKAIELHKQQKEHAITFYKQHFSYFSTLYPNCFNETPKPLAIGIDKAITAEEAKKPEEEQITQKVVRRFLAKYTRSVAYKEAMQSAGSNRINLQGEEVENVTPEHAEIARKSLEEWQNKKAARENNKQKRWK